MLSVIDSRDYIWKLYSLVSIAAKLNYKFGYGSLRILGKLFSFYMLKKLWVRSVAET